MKCNFSKTMIEKGDIFMFDRQYIHKSISFRYLGSVIQESGEIYEDVAHRVQTGWLKWRSASRVLCDRHISLRLKGKFYRIAVRPAMLHGTECWAVRKEHIQKMCV